MRERKKLIDVFNDPFTSGIFSSLQSFDVPWKNESIADVLDLSFITNYGARNISPLVQACIDENGKLTAAKQALIAKTVYNLNKVNWIKEYNTLLFDYNPIENYSMVETHEGTDTVTDTPTNWKETQTQTPTNWKETETQTPTNWKETQTQTPTNWKETETQTPTNWKETQTQTPTNWKETETQTPTNWKETETKTPTNWKETETQTPTNWTETVTNTVGEDGYTETETQTPTDWKETVKGLQADNQADATNSVYAFNSATAVKTSESNSKVSSKTETERTGTFETEKSYAGEKITTNERTGTFETEKETSGTFETETERTGTYQTETSHTGTFETETERTGTFETEKETSGTFETETERTGTFETERETSGTFETETERTGTYEKQTEYDTTLRRSGNIGVTTSQQMIQSERDLWLWNFFQDVVFKDISKVLTLSIY